MKKIFFCFLLSLHIVFGFGQSITTKLTKAYQVFENDSQLQNSISSLYVIDAKTGKVVFDKNSQIGLAPASTQKIITAATAYELLGKDFRYKTYFGTYKNHFAILGTGDPTFGSWRYHSTKDTVIFDSVFSALILNNRGRALFREPYVLAPEESLPNGKWIYEDIANYYGATSMGLNWHENQDDVVFIPGKIVGDKAELDTTLTVMWRWIRNEVKTGTPGSGDNAYVYLEPTRSGVIIKGTVPSGVQRFTIAASDFVPSCTFYSQLTEFAKLRNFYVANEEDCLYQSNIKFGDTSKLETTIYVYQSPTFDSINYWFLRKSINLYGEALVKTFAYEKGKEVTTENGIALLKDNWKNKGIKPAEINIVDGSGLSPLNRVTTHAQVTVLQYAKKQSWFSGYYDGFPEYNGMKMKSGTINRVKGFCGYHKSQAGQEYIFSFLVNNYNGPASSLVQKMYKVLDVLK